MNTNQWLPEQHGPGIAGAISQAASAILCVIGGRAVRTELRKAADAAAKRTGLEPVEAAKLSECHELLVEVVG